MLISYSFFMKLYIKTPRPKYNKYIPHLLEHCVLQSNNIKNFFDTQLPIYASTASWYTEFEFDEEYLQPLQEKFKIKISQETFQLQSKIIKQELNWASFWQKVYIDTYKKISWNKNLISNKIENWVTLKDIHEYQKKYYQPENIILADDNNEIIKFWWIEKALKIDPIIELKSEIKYKQTKFQWDIYDNIYTKYDTPYDVLLLDFFYDLINDYNYYKTEKKWKYRYDSSDISLTDEYIILNFEQKYLPKKIEKNFFENYKVYYKRWIEKCKNREYIPIIALFTKQYISKEQHIKYIENIDINTLDNIIPINKF